MILVTGASGFIGRHLVDGLRQANPAAAIRLLDLSVPAEGLPEGIEALSGTIEEPDVVATAVANAETVVHLAAKVEPDSRDSDVMDRINVKGTNTVYRAAVEAGCRLFIHLSSAGVYGPPRTPEPFRECDPAAPETPYQSSKRKAEEELFAAASKTTILNILRPAGVYGRGSRLEIPTYRAIQRQRWSFEFTGGVIVHPTHVSDVVQAIIALIKQPAPHGTIFNVGGERRILLQDLQALIASTLHVPRRRVVLPPLVAAPIVAVAEPLIALRNGRRNPLLRGISSGGLFSSAVDDRCFRQMHPDVSVRPLRDGLQEHVEWARAMQLL